MRACAILARSAHACVILVHACVMLVLVCVVSQTRTAQDVFDFPHPSHPPTRQLLWQAVAALYALPFLRGVVVVSETGDVFRLESAKGMPTRLAHAFGRIDTQHLGHPGAVWVPDVNPDCLFVSTEVRLPCLSPPLPLPPSFRALFV